MFTYNVTFVVSPEKEGELINYLGEEIIPVFLNTEFPPNNIELKKLVEVGGEKPGSDNGLSIAMAATFETEESAHHWNDNILIPALSDFSHKFGKHALFFVTLLENLLSL